MARLILFIGFTILSLTSSGQVRFEDVSKATGIDSDNWNSGVAIADYDEDGDEDVYVSVANGPNLMYRSNGNGTFMEVASEIGVEDSKRSYASCWADLDNDGDLDLIVANRLEPFSLFINDGAGQFTNQASGSFLGNAGRIRSLMVADYDKDGWLDIYVANFGMDNQLFRNNHNLTFTDLIYGARANDVKQSMGGVFFDYDNDNDQDLYLTRDSNQDFVFYENIGDGFFEDKSAITGLDYIGQGMGVDIADVNKDGWMDVYVTNLFDNALFINQQDGTFEDITATAKVNDYGMTWGTTFFDFNNDGLLDLYSVNETRFSPHPNVLYENVGDNVFEIVGEDDPISSSESGYGAAYFDADLDGKLDMFIANYGGEGNQLLMNRCTDTGNWFRVKAKAEGNNAFAVGSRINVYAGGELFADEVTVGSGYCSQHSYILHFGLGDINRIDSMSVHYPDGRKGWFYGLEVNTTFIARQSQSTTSTIDLAQEWDASIQPNPTDGLFVFSFDLKEKVNHVSIALLDATGKRMAHQNYHGLASGGHQIDFDLKKYPQGIYFIEVLTEKGTFSNKIIRL